MRSVLGQAQESAPTVQTIPRNGAPPTVKEIPYDYVATFALQGKRGNRVQDVINISTDGAFVAAAIGYSFIPASLLTVVGSPDPDESVVTILSSAVGQVRTDTVSTLFQTLSRVIPGQQWFTLFSIISRGIVDPRMALQCLLVRLCGIDFKYSIIDSGTGRELQNQPIHNIAGLGKSDGDRPFRPLAKPMLFMPRSTIRIEVEEVSEGPIYGFTDANGRRIGAELFIVFHK